MNAWRNTSLVLAFLVIVLTVLYVREMSITHRLTKEREAESRELATLRVAASDTMAYLNWHHLNQDDGLDKEALEHNLRILRSKYFVHFPEWAERRFSSTTLSVP